MDKLTAYLGHRPRAIAIFRAIKLGDLLCAVPAFRALRASYPEAHIALISLPWAEEFAACYPQYVDEFIAFPGWPGLPEQPVVPEKTVAFLQAMQDRKWDVMVQMQGNGTLVNAMLGLCGATVLAGYYLPDVSSEQWAADKGLFQPYPEKKHEVLRHVGLMNFLGIETQGDALEPPHPAIGSPEIKLLSAQSEGFVQEYVCIHAGGISGRRWPEVKFAAVADALAEQGYAVVLTGTKAEEPIIEAVRRLMKHPAISLAGQTNLASLTGLLKKAALVVSNDTGVAHLAVACQTPSVVVFTSADPAEWGPLNTDRHRIVLEADPDSVQLVIQEATHLLKELKTDLLL